MENFATVKNKLRAKIVVTYSTRLKFKLSRSADKFMTHFRLAFASTNTQNVFCFLVIMQMDERISARCWISKLSSSPESKTNGYYSGPNRHALDTPEDQQPMEM